MSGLLSGSASLARGALAAGVSLVCGYPGAPATSVVNAILDLSSPDQVRVEWTSNEKVALEMAFGASVGGMRALLCVKSVGLNIALDPLMVINLSGCNAGLVILVGDDPGSWGSQNEQDSRILGLAAEIPVLEPATVPDSQKAMQDAFALSEALALPVMVRFTRALVLAQQFQEQAGTPAPGPPPPYRRDSMVVLPVNAIPYHQRLQERLNLVRNRFEYSTLNSIEGEGRRGVISAGFAYQKMQDLLGSSPDSVSLRLFKLGTFNPLPAASLIEFLRGVDSVLVLEETAPLVERAVRDLAQAAGLALPILGRDPGPVPGAGELFAPQFAAALNAAWPELELPTEGVVGRPRPSREPLCEGCPYRPTFDRLLERMSRAGGRDAFIVVGEPGCMVRSQMPPYELMDIKNSLGSSIGMAAGVALNETGKRVIALCGDSAFLHSGLSGLIDSVRLGVRFLLLILDNSTTALSGGQPHPGSRVDARGRARRAVDLVALARAAGAQFVQRVDLDAGQDLGAPLQEGLDREGVAVLVVRGRCPHWSQIGAPPVEL